ncbi:hypothetical protein ACVWZD_005642 [Streptomyces sp. TE3672]
MNGLGYLRRLPGRADSAAGPASRTSLVSHSPAVSMLEAKAEPDEMRLPGRPDGEIWTPARAGVPVRRDSRSVICLSVSTGAAVRSGVWPEPRGLLPAPLRAPERPGRSTGGWCPGPGSGTTFVVPWRGPPVPDKGSSAEDDVPTLSRSGFARIPAGCGAVAEWPIAIDVGEVPPRRLTETGRACPCLSAGSNPVGTATNLDLGRRAGALVRPGPQRLDQSPSFDSTPGWGALPLGQGLGDGRAELLRVSWRPVSLVSGGVRGDL